MWFGSEVLAKVDKKRAGRSDQATRQRILKVALKLFAQRGHQGTTISEIARQAEVAQPLLHYYFDSKTAIWEAAIEMVYSEHHAEYTSAEHLIHSLEPRQVLEMMLRHWVQLTARYPEVGMIMQQEAGQNSPRLDWLVEHHLRPTQALTANLLKMAQKDGCIKEIPVEYLIPIITGAIRFFFSSAPYIKAVYEIDVNDTEVIKRYADYIVDILLHGLLLPAAKQ
ncbi:MAG: AcrR family transcriptional regulator [Candidatus Azotimanducaceae bacterium]|jgi:TetR/AcrR family transcriptional regulator